jgi:imidazolonepropionase
MREGVNAGAGELILLHSARQLLTLHGSPGPRRGPDMRNLAMIPDGAVLIRNGVIEDVGPTRRVANLVRAKRARELDATGRIVLPAFVDPDAQLVTQALSSGQKARIEKNALAGENVEATAESLRVMSKRRMEMRSAAMAHALASYGVLTIGSSTSSADDPRNVNRILTVHKTLEGAPLRIRSVLAWPAGGLRPSADQQTELGEWLNTIRARELASLVEFVVGDSDPDGLRSAANLSVQRGFAVRLRCHGEIGRETVELAVRCGAIALHWSPVSARPLPGELASNCVLVAPGSELVGCDARDGRAVRSGIDSGLALALSSAFRAGTAGTLNMQYILHLACSRLKLTPEEAITAATHNAAAALRFADSAGSLAPGRLADLIVMDVPDYRDLITRAGHHDVVIVMRAGRIIYRRPPLTLE